MAIKKTTARKRSKQQASPLPALYYQLNSLLHIVRCIGQHEDELCVLLHEMRRSNKVCSDVASELASVLDLMPLQDYSDDISALQRSLAGLNPSRLPAKSKKTAVKRTVAKKKTMKRPN